MIDSGFIATLTIIFLGAMIGSYLRGSSKDRCLKDFDGYHITVEKKDGHIIWGTMHLESTGMELEYRTDVQDLAHIETSYLLYRSEFQDLQGIYRYSDELTPEDRRRREKDLRKSFHPGLFSVLGRRLRNFTNTATDSLSEAISFITGQAKKPGGHYITDTGQAYLQKLGKNIIGYVGTNFDPLLEEYVGAKVVVEVMEAGAIHEYVGVLKEYSADFLEVLDVFYPQAQSVNLAPIEQQEALVRDVKITFEDSSFRVQNLGMFPLLLHKVKSGDRESEINAVIGPGDGLKLQPLALTEARTAGEEELSVFFEGLSKEEEDQLEEGVVSASYSKAEAAPSQIWGGPSWEEAIKEGVQFDFRIIRVLDMIVPRTHALIRHKAERYDPNQVLGEIGRVGILSERERDLEAAYRKALRRNPNDVISAMGLSQLLIQGERFEEAAQWLKVALQNRQGLTDGGRLAELQLRWVEGKLSGQRKVVRA